MSAGPARSCHGKKAHESKAKAERHRQRLIGRGATPDALETYQCKHCSTTAEPRWHVGHARGRTKWRA